MKISLPSLFQVHTIIFSLFSVVAITSCGGGSSDTSQGISDSNNDLDTMIPSDEQGGEVDNELNTDGLVVDQNVLTGVLIDSPVEGVTFNTETQSGKTNSRGEFEYISGELVNFSIGDTMFPVVTAEPRITPIELSASAENPGATAINIARFLQTLDVDGNPDNGIVIPNGAPAASFAIDFDQPIAEFESDSSVVNMVSNSGSVNVTLIDESLAIMHVQESLDIDLSEGESPDVILSNDLTETSFGGLTGSVINFELEDGGFFDFDIIDMEATIEVVNQTGVFQTSSNYYIAPTNGACLTVTLDLSSSRYIDYLDGNTLKNVRDLIDTTSSEVSELTFTSNNEFQYSDGDNELRDAQFFTDGRYEASATQNEFICLYTAEEVRLSFIGFRYPDESRIFIDFEDQ